MTVGATTTRESDKFVLRLPDGMRDRIKTVAAENQRSMTAEIIARLESSLSHDSEDETGAQYRAARAMIEFLGRVGVPDEEKFKKVQESIRPKAEPDNSN